VISHIELAQEISSVFRIAVMLRVCVQEVLSTDILLAAG
jgi:hypothetical protein